MPKDIIINIQLQQLAKRMCIPYFNIFAYYLTNRESVSKRKRYCKFE